MSEGVHEDTPAGTEDTPAGAEGEPRSAEEIRTDIEQTREQLGETVEALAEKTDVKAQARNRVDAARETVTQNLGAARDKADEFASKATEATPDSAGAGVQQLTATVQAKPLPYAIAGAFLAGAIMGWLLGRR
jgi:Protein of unknown function (DUF3618)